MDNTRTLISSSIFSIIIVVVGLFLLCVGRAPQINTDASFTSGGTGEGSDASSDEDLLSLLNEAGDEMELADDSELFGEDVGTGGDDDLSSFLNEGENTYNAEQFAENDDQGMDDIMKLLEAENTGEQNLDHTTDMEQDWAATEFNESSGQNEQSNSQGSKTTIDDLSAEVSNLEQILSSKNAEHDNLQSELSQYDQRIAELESQQASGYGGNIKTANYYETRTTDAAESGANLNSIDRNIMGNFQIAYDYGLQLFHNHRYQQAVNQFHQLLEMYPRHPVSDNCQYWIGECCFAQGKYYQAIVEFTKVAAYDEADKKDDAQLMMGVAFLKLGETKQAQSELDWLVSTFASSEYVTRAYRYLRQL